VTDCLRLPEIQPDGSGVGRIDGGQPGCGQLLDLRTQLLSLRNHAWSGIHHVPHVFHLLHHSHAASPVLSARSRQWSTGALAVLLSRTESRGQTGPRAAAGDRDAAGRGRQPHYPSAVSVWTDGLLPKRSGERACPGLLPAPLPNAPLRWRRCGIHGQLRRSRTCAPRWCSPSVCVIPRICPGPRRHRDAHSFGCPGRRPLAPARNRKDQGVRDCSHPRDTAARDGPGPTWFSGRCPCPRVARAPAARGRGGGLCTGAEDELRHLSSPACRAEPSVALHGEQR
jgi:hypothetical protein